ncbi:MAG: tRNA (N(6)-L-threonylcarbamoyladenosine(37)-C(2))-methylthiotransferase [Candidatus Bathyarchaeota archaeon]|nr:MAG: tRNA (N(6)-L-threonylcarbamoyladenosine(37)-C(2))-methylthiotransferase [Candidatus Bathyarchaeota archaeon]
MSCCLDFQSAGEEVAEVPKRVYVKSFGCPSSRADGEVMVGCLSEARYEVVDEVEDAQVLIYNTCGVKSPTENRMMSLLKRAPKDKKLVVAGCLPLINTERLRTQLNYDGLVGPGLGCGIVDVVRAVCRGERVVLLKRDCMPSLDLPRVAVNEVVGVVPISQGCLGSCAYCCVRFARGQLRSHGVAAVVERVKRDLDSGAREIWLTSQDTACYGSDIGTGLAELLRAVCKIDSDFFIRIGMMNPDFALEMLDDLVESYKDAKVFKFLHLPVQSGDDEVLGRMNRFYTAEDFRRIIERFRSEFPRITIATDVICGFPGESEKAFERSMELVEDIQPDIVNVSRFFPRPSTAAKGMVQLPASVVKGRSGRMSRLAGWSSCAKNESWLGWEGRVIVDEIGNRSGSWVGRNFAYKPVVLRDEGVLLGKFVDVRIVGASATYLNGEICD